MAHGAHIETRACKYAVQEGWLSRKLKTHNRRGAPDRMFMKEGVIIFAEFKEANDVLSKLQIHEHKQYLKSGFKVHVVDNIEHFKAIIAVHS